MSVHRPPRSRHPTPIAQFHWQGGLLPEDALQGWDDPGSVRTRGFHCAISSPGTEAEGQWNGDAQSRYHGVLARGGHPPNHRWRGLVTPARRGKGIQSISNTEFRTPAERHAAMTWAQRLKRVFNIDIEVCGRCGGSVRVIACIEDQDIIDRILTHLRQKEQETPTRPLLVPPTRAPPGTLPLFAGRGAR